MSGYQNQLNICSRETERTLIKIGSLPFIMGFFMTGPSFALACMRASQPVISGLNLTGLSEFVKNTARIYPTVTSKQISRSMTAGTTSTSAEAIEAELIETDALEMKALKPKTKLSTYGPITLAVSAEALFSGITGVIQMQSTGKIQPIETSWTENFGLHVRAALKLTPYTYRWTTVASIANVSGIAILTPEIQKKSQAITNHPTLQTLLSLSLSSYIVSLITTPINTLGARYLKNIAITQTGSQLVLTPQKSLLATYRGIMQQGIQPALKTLFKPYPITGAMTLLAYSVIGLVDKTVDVLVPDAPIPRSHLKAPNSFEDLTGTYTPSPHIHARTFQSVIFAETTTSPKSNIATPEPGWEFLE